LYLFWWKSADVCGFELFADDSAFGGGKIRHELNRIAPKVEQVSRKFFATKISAKFLVKLTQRHFWLTARLRGYLPHGGFIG